MESRQLLSATVATGAPSAITSSGATVSASVDAHGVSTSVSFEYSTSASFAKTVPNFSCGTFDEAIDSAGNLFGVTTSGSLVEITATGAVSTIKSNLINILGLAVDSSGDLYLTQTGSGSVLEIHANHTTTTTIPVGMQGSPFGLGVDSAGDLFFINDDTDAIQELPKGGKVTTVSTGSIATDDDFAVDSAGDLLYVAPDETDIIERTHSGAVKTFASGISNGVFGVSVDAAGDVFAYTNVRTEVLEFPHGGGAPVALFTTPTSSIINVATGPGGGTLIEDQSVNSGLITINVTPPTVAGSPSPVTGSANTNVSASLKGLSANTLYYYRPVIVSGGVTTFGTANSFFTAPAATVTTNAASSVASTSAKLNASINPEGPSASVRFQYSTSSTFAPTVVKTLQSTSGAIIGVAVDRLGDVYTANGGVQEIKPNGSVINRGSGFGVVSGVAVDAAGDLFVTDSNKQTVDEILPNNQVIVLASGFNFPSDIAVNSAGDLFVSDAGANTAIEIFPNGSEKTLATINSPSAIALDSSGNVYVADESDGLIEKISPTGFVSTIGPKFADPLDVTVDSSGNVYVADDSNTSITVIHTNGSVTQLGSGLNQPDAVKTDPAGNVYIATLVGKVIELSPPTATPTTSTLSGSSTQNVSAGISGLSANTTYYFRAIAFAPGGVIVGKTNSFKTSSAPVMKGDVLPASLPASVFSSDPAVTESVSDPLALTQTDVLDRLKS